MNAYQFASKKTLQGDVELMCVFFVCFQRIKSFPIQGVVSSLLSNNIAGLSRIHMIALWILQAKYGEPGNFGTGYWGRKIKDPAERLSAFIAGFLVEGYSHLLHG